MVMARMHVSNCKQPICPDVFPQPGHRSTRAHLTAKSMSRALGKASLSGTGVARANNGLRSRPVRVTATTEVIGVSQIGSMFGKLYAFVSWACKLTSDAAGQGSPTERQFSKAAAKVRRGPLMHVMRNYMAGLNGCKLSVCMCRLLRSTLTPSGTDRPPMPWYHTLGQS